jgi:hypothetical protein
MHENVTLAQLRQRIGQALNEITTGTITTSGDTTGFTSTDLLDSIESEAYYEGAWVWMLDNYSSNPITYGERRISVYDPSKGQVTFSREWEEARSSGLTFEVHRMIRPSELNRLINRGLGYTTKLCTVNLGIPVEDVYTPDEKISGGTFEYGVVGGWYLVGQGNFTTTADGANGTTYCASLTGWSTYVSPFAVYVGNNLEVGTTYKLSFYYKDGGCGGYLTVGTSSDTTTYTALELDDRSWTLHEYEFTATDTEIMLQFMIFPALYEYGDTIYFDEVSITIVEEEEEEDEDEDTHAEFDLTLLCADSTDEPSWLNSPDQVIEVYWHSGEAEERTVEPVPTWEIKSIYNDTYEEDHLYLLFPSREFSDTDYIILEAWRTEDPYTDEGTGKVIHTDWVEPICTALAYEYLIRHGPAQDTDRYRGAMQAELAKFHERSKLYVTRRRPRIQLAGSVYRTNAPSSTIVRW